MEAKELLAQLKAIAPNVAFSCSRSIDENYTWDGDGPDPINEGYFPYDVEVRAKAIVEGETIEGNAYLGGSYYKPEEPIDDIHGYLPQKLEEAATELLGKAMGAEPITKQCKAAIGLLNQEMKDRYDKQMKS